METGSTTRPGRCLVLPARLQRYLSVPRRVAVCVASLVLLLFVIPDRASITCSDPRPDTQQTLKLPDDSTAEDCDDSGTLTLPIDRLQEPALPSRSWFSGDAGCARFVTRFARPGSLPDARLVSFPRSGNTWTRYLLEAATGFVTCGPTYDSEATEKLPSGALPAVADIIVKSKHSLTTSAELQAAGFIGEHVSPLTRTCIVGKSHMFPPTWRRATVAAERTSADQSSNGSSTFFSTLSSNSSYNSSGYALPGVLLVRDPFRAIISVRHLFANNSILVQRSRAGAAAFSGPDWARFVEKQSRYWFELANEWADGPRQTLLVAYERLVADPAAELRRMLRFLGVAPARQRLRCALRHVRGTFRNAQHPVVPDAAVFDADTRRTVWGRIRWLDDELASRGYQRLPLEKYAFFAMT